MIWRRRVRFEKNILPFDNYCKDIYIHLPFFSTSTNDPYIKILYFDQTFTRSHRPGKTKRKEEVD